MERAATVQITSSSDGAPVDGEIYFSVDVETDGPIPGPFSLLAFAIVEAGFYDGRIFKRPKLKDAARFYCELQPISDHYQAEALNINRLDRSRLKKEGLSPEIAMTKAANWIKDVAGPAKPVLVAYPLSFDWSWLYWYFVAFSEVGSPFSHSSCFDLKTAFAVKAHRPISEASRSKLLPELRSDLMHTHNALDDAIEQAEIFANLFEWKGSSPWEG